MKYKCILCDATIDVIDTIEGGFLLDCACCQFPTMHPIKEENNDEAD